MRRTIFFKKASMTIELALLMPGIFAVLIFIIFSGYYCHDKCVIERGAYSAVYKLSYEEEYCGNSVDLSELFHREIDGRLIGKWELTVEGDSDNVESTIVVEGRMKSFESMFMRYLSKIIFNVELTESAYKVSGPKYIRGY